MRLTEIFTPEAIDPAVIKADEDYDTLINSLRLMRNSESLSDEKIEGFEKNIMALCWAIANLHGYDPTDVYKFAWEAEWKQFQSEKIGSELEEISTLLDNNEFDLARERISRGRSNWPSKRWNIVSSRLNQLSPPKKSKRK